MTCSIAGCEKPVKVKSQRLCGTHYYRLRVHGDPLAGRISPQPGRTCSIGACGRSVYARGWCEMHYKRWLINGDPLIVQSSSPPPNTPQDLWRHVKIGAPDDCWPFQSACNPQGYGKFKMGRREYRAHRVAYELATGQAPGALQVCHSCDNPPCCNPAHLFLGTALDNNRDKAGKDRQAKGSANGRAKLTEGQVREIRRRRAAGEKIVPLAREFGVAHTLISAVTLYPERYWRHVV